MGCGVLEGTEDADERSGAFILWDNFLKFLTVKKITFEMFLFCNS